MLIIKKVSNKGITGQDVKWHMCVQIRARVQACAHARISGFSGGNGVCESSIPNYGCLKIQTLSMRMMTERHFTSTKFKQNYKPISSILFHSGNLFQFYALSHRTNLFKVAGEIT